MAFLMMLETLEPVERAAFLQAEAVVQRFMNACLSGDLRELLAVLTDDAVLYADGGGRVHSALRPILTADRISRFYLGIRERALVGGEVTFVRVKGEIGACLRQRNGNVSVMAFAFEGERIRAIYAMNNPEKRRGLRVGTAGAAGVGPLKVSSVM